VKYKLTDKHGQTRNDTQWGENVTHRATGKGTELCSNQVMHCYSSPEMAVFFDCIHGGYGNEGLLWECRGRKVSNDGTKIGCKSLTTIRQIDKPTITIEQRIEIATRCSLGIYHEKNWVKWDHGWLSGKDRSYHAADAAAYYAEAVAESAAHAAYYAAHAADGVNVNKVIKGVLSPAVSDKS